MTISNLYMNLDFDALSVMIFFFYIIILIIFLVAKKLLEGATSVPYL